MRKATLSIFFLLICAQYAFSFAGLGTRIEYNNFSGGNFPMAALIFVNETKVSIIDGLEFSCGIGPQTYYLSEANGYTSSGYYYTRKTDSSIYIESSLRYRLLDELKAPFSLETYIIGSNSSNTWKLYTEETDETLNYEENLSLIALHAKLSKAIGEGRAFFDFGVGTQTSAVDSIVHHSAISSIKIGADVDAPGGLLIYGYLGQDSGLISWYTGFNKESRSNTWAIGVLKDFSQ